MRDPLQKILFKCTVHGKRHISEAVAFIQNSGAVDPNNTASWGLFAIAVHNNRPDLAKLLVEKGLSVTSTHPENGNTTLHLAASAGNLEVAQYLITNGANVSSTNKENKAPADLLPEKASDELKTLLPPPSQKTFTLGSKGSK